MPLDLKSLTSVPGNQNYPRLAPKTWSQKVLAYRDLIAEQHRLEQAAHALKARVNTLRAELDKACGGAPIAFCGEQVLTWTDTAPIAAVVTLATGEKVPLGALRSLILPDGRAITPAAVATIYGGRAGSRKLDVRP